MTQNFSTSRASQSDRRSFLAIASCAALAGLTLPTKVAFAGGGGGGGGAGASTQRFKPVYSPSEFTRLSKREMGELWGRYGKLPDGTRVKVTGFSAEMTFYLVNMMYDDRASAKRLIRDMSKIKDRKKRAERLAQEKRSIDTRIKKLKAALKRAQEKKLKGAINETKRRIKDAERYREGVVLWQKFPHEGTRSN